MVKGSPVVPGSTQKILEEGDQVLYTVTILRGQYQVRSEALLVVLFLVVDCRDGLIKRLGFVQKRLVFPVGFSHQR